jgi:peptide deformylase
MSATITVEKRKLEKPPLELHYLGDRVLRQPAKRIAKVDDSIRQLAKEMLQTMYSSNGIGLVIDCEPDKPENPPLILINPQIIGYSRELCKAEEGCLSIPDVFLDVIRPQAIEVSYKDEQGKPRKLQANGLLARAIQHEMDHLNGVMFVDRVDNDLALNEELKKHGFSVQAVKPVEKVTK